MPMIHLEEMDRGSTVQTAPVVCMHCEDPTCAKVCPADAIKQDALGVVHTASKPRCVACSNCVLACPFGVPKMPGKFELMMKCDMCYDRTSVGKKPMCATVCPSGALYFGDESYIAEFRREVPVNTFSFGKQIVKTKVFMMAAPLTPRINVDMAVLCGFQNEKAEAIGFHHQDMAEESVWNDLPFRKPAREKEVVS
ncbi:MAG: 4Fe-4S ferredoxin [Verrucomicrobiales bacterium]|nr:4Fe-4S ferredoxin [Verrucomicrobiales bacterium]